MLSVTVCFKFVLWCHLCFIASERDCLTRWISLLMTSMVSFRPKIEDGAIFLIFRSSSDLIKQKVYFTRLMRVFVSLVM